MNNNMYQPPVPPPPRPYEDNTDVMSMSDWLLTLFIIMFVPCVGIVMAFVWAFGNNGNLNRKHFCQAYLVIMGISVLITVVFYILFAAVLFTNWF